MKRTVATLTLALALLMPATAAFAASENGNGPRFTCTSPDGSVQEGVTPSTAKKLERNAGYTCVRN